MSTKTILQKVLHYSRKCYTIKSQIAESAIPIPKTLYHFYTRKCYTISIIGFKYTTSTSINKSQIINTTSYKMSEFEVQKVQNLHITFLYLLSR